MTHVRRMENTKLVELLLQAQWYFMFLMATGLGVVAMDKYRKLRDKEKMDKLGIEAPINRTKFIDKFCLAVFVCYLVHGFYDYRGYPPKQEPFFILLASFLHYPIAGFIVNRLWPIIQKAITGGNTDV